MTILEPAETGLFADGSHEVPDGYVVGLERTGPPYKPLAHLYKGAFADPGTPMCRFCWNRDNGTSYSIWRGNVGRKRICRTCLRRARSGRDSIEANGTLEMRQW